MSELTFWKIVALICFIAWQGSEWKLRKVLAGFWKFLDELAPNTPEKKAPHPNFSISDKPTDFSGADLDMLALRKRLRARFRPQAEKLPVDDEGRLKRIEEVARKSRIKRL